MRHALGLALIACSITSSGCALVQDSCTNVLVGIKTPLEEHREKARNRQWAETAWQQVLCTSHAFMNQVGPSEDYAKGFKEGFAEYLFRGGDGEPPLVAPLRYRDARYQNEQGYHAVQDWFAGYRHGTAMAHDSGARKWITGPSSLQAELDSRHVHAAPPPAERPAPAKPTPVPIPLPEPQVLPQPSEVQGSIEPAPAPLEPTQPETVETVPVKDEFDRMYDEQKTPASQPDAAPAPPLPEPVRLQIRRITEAAQAAPDAAPLPPPPEAARLRIHKITDSARSAPELVIVNGTTDEARIRITGVRDATPTRARITEIMAIPAKD